MTCFLLSTAKDIDEQRARLVAMACKAQVKALLSLITCDSAPAFCEQLTVEMKRMLYNYLAPIFGAECDGAQ